MTDLFGNLTKKKSGIHSRIIKITQAEVVEGNPFSLLEGFTEMKAVTFSSSLAMLREVKKLGYKKVKLIISLPDDFQELKELQLINLLKKETKEVLSVLDLDAELKYLPKSHSKFYILSNAEGKKRLVLGSLNFSVSAWKGNQQEEVIYTDNPELIAVYEKVFSEIEKKAKNFISKKEVVKQAEKNGVEVVNINALTLTPENAQKIKDLQEIGVGIAVKNVVQFVQVAEVKKSTEKVRDMINEAVTFAEKVCGRKSEILYSPVKNVGKMISSEDAPREKIAYSPERGWEYNDALAVVPDDEKVLENLFCLEEIFGHLKKHGAEKETLQNVMEAVMFAFAGSYLWSVRQREDAVPENFPVFGILAGTTKAGKSLTLSIVSMLTHGRIRAVEYSKDFIVDGYRYSMGKSSANIFERYFDGDLPFADGVLPVMVNEVAEKHLKGESKLSSIIKTITNSKIPRQHGTALMSMNISFYLLPEVARRVFFLEYTFSLHEHKKLEQKIRGLVKRLNPHLFYAFLDRIDPLSVEVRSHDPLEPVREFFSDVCSRTGIHLPAAPYYIGDVEAKAESELRHVFSVEQEVQVVEHPTKKIPCYLVKKEKFRYPPPTKAIVEDKGEVYYLNKSEVDAILCRKEKPFWKRFFSSLSG